MHGSSDERALTMESRESGVSVLVCREEKLVLGLSKRTSCAAVVRALLEEQELLCGSARTYRIVEKWRGFERVLPDRTKMLRLWEAWGDEQRNVKFVLVRGDASVAEGRARSAEARVVLSSPPCVPGGEAPSTLSSISPEKQRRVVRKAFRKLEKINKKAKEKQKARREEASAVERMETLAHLVISQDLTLRQQVQRISELDSEIESCEAKVHLDRMKRHGVNYVQDTYLVEGDPGPADLLAELEEYACLVEEVVRLQEELLGKEALVEIISGKLREELDQRWMQRRRGSHQEDAGAAGHPLALEAERLRTELDASSYIGLRLCSDLEDVRADLELTEEICAAMEEEMRDLLERVDVLEAKGQTGGEEGSSGGVEEQRKGEWGGDRGLSKSPVTVNDDDSDTGLSSLHSQESDGLPVWESPV